MTVNQKRNQLKRKLRQQEAWLRNPPHHLGITEADVEFEKKVYGILYRKLEQLQNL
tara:strand:- start:366 stop:533 length:168 start_codon:yes stop_codon:yes gene_type:complete